MMTDIFTIKNLFPEGRTVLLKIGSPAMVVEWTREDGFVPVAWFEGRELRRDAFSHEALVRVFS